MKIDLGDGSYLEPDEEPRNSPFHKRIIKVSLVPNTRYADLECGHRVMMLGNLGHAAGVVLCTQCRDARRE